MLYTTPRLRLTILFVCTYFCDLYFSNKRGQLKTSYKNDYLNTNLDVDSSGGPTIRGALVGG